MPACSVTTTRRGRWSLDGGGERGGLAHRVLEPNLAVRVVDGLDAAIAHIRDLRLGPHRRIVTEDRVAAEAFAERVDSAIVVINASTQFADGANSGSARRSASRPTGFMRAVPWAPSN